MINGSNDLKSFIRNSQQNMNIQRFLKLFEIYRHHLMSMVNLFFYLQKFTKFIFIISHRL
jgi:hypothetical protein